ncbi:hypothetical protein EJB05_08019 [Eragrostis curvula]|uniref:DUF3615 domain-containing protein n=1 Tax=Eragrostis curvula TaxID=38414 RepID=A0A5J9WK87_9POAL|nr:hypothetical protein EJB05_08019 [Eragrostis curvula]
MASSREAFHADEEETTPLVGVGQTAPEIEAPDGAAPMERVVRTRAEEYEERLRRIILVPPAPFPWWWRLPFIGPNPNAIPVGQPLDHEQLEMLRKSREPGHFKILAMGRQLATDCLQHYNAMHPDNEYEPATGKVTKNLHFDNGACWTHGNFVARRKRSGCFSFLPAPRTLFFFEVAYSNGSSGVMNQLLKPIVSWVSLFGGLNVVVANSIPFARHAPVAFIYHILALGRYFHVYITMPVESVKCAINAPLCCTQMFSGLAVLIRATPTEHCYHRALRTANWILTLLYSFGTLVSWNFVHLLAASRVDQDLSDEVKPLRGL